MATETNIAWTDSTFNPWWGCSSVSAGCDNCYAEALDRRTGGNHFGVGALPRTLSESYWKNPDKWQKEAAATGVRRKVFCGSMCDWTDKNAPAGQLERLWEKIRRTGGLDWQLLTKRAPNIERCLPSDWGTGYENVWLGVTVENRRQGVPRIDYLRKVPARVRFLSIEPLLEDLGQLDLQGIHWVIIGGESGPGARPMNSDWVDNIVHQCRNQGVPVFFKQWGAGPDKGGCLLKGRETKEFPYEVRMIGSTFKR